MSRDRLGDEILIDHVLDELAPADREETERRLRTEPDARGRLDDFREIVEAVQTPVFAEAPSGVLAAILNEQALRREPPLASTLRALRNHRLIPVAAAAVLMLIVVSSGLRTPPGGDARPGVTPFPVADSAEALASTFDLPGALAREQDLDPDSVAWDSVVSWQHLRSGSGSGHDSL